MRNNKRNLEKDGKKERSMIIGRDIERKVIVEVGEKVDRRKIEGSVVKENILRERIGGEDRKGGREGVKIVNGSVVMKKRIGGRKWGIEDILKKVEGFKSINEKEIEKRSKVKVEIILERKKELVFERKGIVRVMERKSEIGLRIKISVVGIEMNVGIEMKRKMDKEI